MHAARNTFIKLSSVTMLALSVSLVGCQTFNNLTGKDVDAVATAEKSEQGYYGGAIEKINKGRYTQAVEDLNNLRTFYPTGQYAEQALLDTMYAQYEAGEFESAASSAERFISLYPSNPQVSYAYYVRGVANMEGPSGGITIFKTNQAERDTSFLRIAFANFQELVNKYPNSPYAPDAAQRMTFLYNQFAKSEINAADWYIEREAYVAAVNRAKWVFQYYPQSDSTPKALSILAYSHEQLGLDDLAQEYKTLLQLNYPNTLTDNGRVNLDTKRDRTFLNKITFGKLGRANTSNTTAVDGQYTGATKTQIVRAAAQLRLPSNATTTSADNTINFSQNRTGGLNIGLGLPEESTEQITSQGSTASAAREATVDPQNINPTRRTTLPSDNVSDRIQLNTPDLIDADDDIEDTE
ncbi:outer membrane protein assembly factor BamD [Psychrobacter sp. DM4]|uniref:outer membrane protein assembly factor BamD n=1 Tax=Psychrobacter sp. DM4 TaxID=3440637 RepID=UPI003F4FE451